MATSGARSKSADRRGGHRGGAAELGAPAASLPWALARPLALQRRATWRSPPGHARGHMPRARSVERMLARARPCDGARRRIGCRAAGRLLRWGQRSSRLCVGVKVAVWGVRMCCMSGGWRRWGNIVMNHAIKAPKRIWGYGFWGLLEFRGRGGLGVAERAPPRHAFPPEKTPKQQKQVKANNIARNPGAEEARGWQREIRLVVLCRRDRVSSESKA